MKEFFGQSYLVDFLISVSMLYASVFDVMKTYQSVRLGFA
jgi:hypothetical protein